MNYIDDITEITAPTGLTVHALSHALGAPDAFATGCLSRMIAERLTALQPALRERGATVDYTADQWMMARFPATKGAKFKPSHVTQPFSVEQGSASGTTLWEWSLRHPVFTMPAFAKAFDVPPTRLEANATLLKEAGFSNNLLAGQVSWQWDPLLYYQQRPRRYRGVGPRKIKEKKQRVGRPRKGLEFEPLVNLMLPAFKTWFKSIDMAFRMVEVEEVLQEFRADTTKARWQAAIRWLLGEHSLEFSQKAQRWVYKPY